MKIIVHESLEWQWKVSAELSEKWVGEWKGEVRWEEEREVRRSGGSECACVFGGGEEDDEGEENVNVSQRIARTQDATDLCIANLSHILSLSGSRCYV